MNGSIRIVVKGHDLKYLAETYKTLVQLTKGIGKDSVQKEMSWHLDVLKQLLEKIGVENNG